MTRRPPTLHFDLERRLLTVTLEGPTGGPDALAAMRAYNQHPDRERVSDVLWDLRSVTGLAIAPEEVKAILSLQRENEHFLGPGRVAVVSENWWVQTITGLLARLSPSRVRQVRAFPWLSEAEAWLEAGRMERSAA